ncbi:hypothetical protein DH2020_027626 [Rehmannia glutinosa]|uniref:Scarecrow-like protein n=1 Tax=Rehmannia glutinosa TaxID=99300 RepID=A0ABR0VXS1_REHGL
MIGMQYNSNKLEARGGVNGYASSTLVASSKCKKDGSFTMNEPISVLDTRSPSPSTSTSTFSSFNNTNPQGNKAVNEPTSAAARGGGKVDLVADLNPPLHHAVQNANLGLENWANLSESGGKQDEILKLLLQTGNQNEAQGIVGFGAIAPVGNVFSDYNTSAFGISGSGFSMNDHIKGKIGLDSNSSLLLENNGDALQCLAPYLAFLEEFQTLDQKVEIFNSHGALDPVLVRNAANPSRNSNSNLLLFGTQQNQPQPFKVPFVDSGQQFLPVKQEKLPQMLQEKALLVPKHEAIDVCNEQQVVYDEIYKAAELIQAGNFTNAQGILARLNHFLSPTGKPFLRSALYMKQALELAFMLPNEVASVPPAQFDGMFKMGAYKIFSEISPVIQFMNFTANQLFLEAVGDAERIHIIDFDIGFGAHWSSFLQELPRKNRGVTPLKITAFASPSTHHSLEITLMHENLTQFANDLGINFELEVVNIDSFDPNCNSVSSLRSSENEAIAVNFPIWSFANNLFALPSYLSLIKRLAPKIMVSLGRGCERFDLPFSHHILHTLQYYEALLESVDAANVTADASNKIEKFLFQPKIESTVLGRLVYPSIMPPWRKLFASLGYMPASISNFAETQAECVLKRMQVRGFHVQRQQASLLLCWQSCELLSVSAWKC